MITNLSLIPDQRYYGVTREGLGRDYGAVPVG
jgi:hypothetical protein